MITMHLTAEEKADFAANGRTWIPPPQKTRMVRMKKNDALLMLPRFPVAHAPLYLQPTLIEGGMLIDAFNAPSTLKLIASACRAPDITNEEIPYQLLEVVDELTHMVNTKPVMFCPSGGDVLLCHSHRCSRREYWVF